MKSENTGLYNCIIYDLKRIKTILYQSYTKYNWAYELPHQIRCNNDIDFK